MLGAYDSIKGGAGINMNDRDVFFLQRDEMGLAKVMTLHTLQRAKPPVTSKDLLGISFMNAVEGSQLPELIFGASMGASLSSVQEQRPAYISVFVESKHNMERHGKSFDMSLDILGYVTYAPYDKDAYQLEWQDPDFATDKEKADTANAFITALVKARGNGIMGDS